MIFLSENDRRGKTIKNKFKKSMFNVCSLSPIGVPSCSQTDPDGIPQRSQKKQERGTVTFTFIIS